MDMKIICRIFLLACLTVLFAAPSAYGQEKVKPQLAIQPFTFHGADDSNYLIEGVRTMLASRIDARVEVGKIIVGEGGSDPAVVAKTLAADLVLSGSITALGSSVSIDVRLLTIATNDSASFFAVAADQSGIIGAVDQLASDIIAKISGEPRQVRSVDQVTVSAPGPAGVLPPPLTVALPGPVISKGSAVGSSLNVTRSQFLAMELQVMDVGDVFGDGGEVLVLAEKHKISFYRQEGNRLVAAGVITDGPKYARVVALNLADFNGNGRAEVYVSASSGNGPSSYAVEWNGSSFDRVFDRQRWYVRPIELPGQGLVLVGQQADTETPARAGIYRLTNKDGKLQKGDEVAVPEKVNLYDFVMADFTGDGQVEIAVQTQQSELLLYNLEGAVLWRGSGLYGHTKRFIGEASGTVSDQPANLQVLTRLLARDVDRDGRAELIAMKNPEGYNFLVKSISSFTGGSIKVMGWNGVGFDEYWSSGEIGSYLATFQANFAGARLYLGLVSKKAGRLFGSYQSVVVGYDLLGKDD